MNASHYVIGAVLMLFVVGLLVWAILQHQKPQSIQWLSQSQAEMWSQDPLVLVYPHFLSGDECQALIQMATPYLARSTVQTHTLEQSPDRTSYTTNLPKGGNALLLDIERRALKLCGGQYSHLEPLQVVRYEPSQFYKPHYDYFVPGATGTEEALKRGGQRTMTLFVYLNDLQKGETGGQTVFPKLHLKIPPRQGSAVFFYNVHPESKKVDDRLLHGGAPPRISTKYGLNVWFREGDFY